MTDDIVCLLKFGKKEHVKEFASGILYCSNAKTFWGIEKDNKIKGQGDILEAGSRIHAQNMVVKEIGTDRTITTIGKSEVLVHAEPASKIPVFCLFAVHQDDCIVNGNGVMKINLSEEKKKTIRDHFPNADTVAVINDVDEFLGDVQKSIGYQVMHEPVHYFNIDKGFKAHDGADVALDMEYFKYVTQDTPPQKEGKLTRYSFMVDYVYRVLFCKDIFFSDEQEYRILLPTETIESGTKYPFSTGVRIEVKSIEDFLK